MSKSYGTLVAATLATSWRRAPAPLNVSREEFSEIVPLLLGSGAGALGWWRVQHSDLRETAAAKDLLAAYRLHALYAEIHGQQIAKVYSLLRAGGIEPILIKGWAIARFYAERGLRPYGDIDLIVHPEQRVEAEEIIRSARDAGFNVDFEHDDLTSLSFQDWNRLYARTQLVPNGTSDVRILAAEDELKLLCGHLLRHGAWRPLWLCDIAAVVESAQTDFDWDYCLRDGGWQAEAIACAIGLANVLLDADTSATPFHERAKRLPRWVVENVLKQWEQPFSSNQAPMSYRAPMATYLRRPSGVFKDLRNRWPNPIVATARMKGRFNEMPRFPSQLAECVSRAVTFLNQLPTQLRERQPADESFQVSEQR